MKAEPKSRWAHKGIEEMRWIEISGKECKITLEARPTYCDRGNWVAKIFTGGELARDMDDHDMWPRYYMDFDRAKLEIEDWMKKRGQWV